MAASADEPDTRPADDVDADGGTTLAGLRIVVLGRLASMSRRDATRLVRSHGGKIVSSDTAPGDGVDWLVLGEETFPNPALAGADDSLDAPLRTAIARGDVVVLSETQLWQRIGLVDGHEHVQRLYTPAMLAELLGVPVGVIRRWQRRGLIAPAREVQRLAYFDFREVATARRLAELLDAGMTPLALEARLAAVRRLLPDVERPLEQLSVIAEGKDLLLRQGGGLIDSGGQRRFDFDAAAAERVGSPRPAPRAESQGASDLSGDDPTITPPTADVGRENWQATGLKLPGVIKAGVPTPLVQDDADALIEHAATAEDDGDLPRAVELYRAALSAGGPSAELCFRLAELLYCQNELAAARERYYMAIELDEDFVEARWNLGCVLAELGERELAVAAFEGALAFHADYPDAHYHLARTLDELARRDEADTHWRAFLELAPDSPWAHLARQRLGEVPLV